MAIAGGCIDTPDLLPASDGAEGGVGIDGAAPGRGDAESEAAPGEDGSAADPTRAACLAVCPVGGTCEGGTCVLACPGLASCKTVTCPAGVPCRITCTGTKSCGVADCAGATSCRIECTGREACERVRSSASQTDIACSGKDACRDVRCDGDVCTVQCAVDAAGNACGQNDAVECCAKQQCTVNGAPGKCDKP